MYTSEALMDIHARAHRSLERLLGHCGTLDAEEFDREIAEEFAYPSVRLQLHHMIGAERYWTGVLLRDFDAEDDSAAYPTVAALRSWRAEVFGVTEDYLRAASAEELNTARPMMTFGGREKVLMPARVVLRTQTHLYTHTGQIAAMCRVIGKPAGSLDFPIV